MKIDKRKIVQSWNNWSADKKIPIQQVILLDEQDINILKYGITRSVWRINVPLSNRNFPVILKIYHGNKTFRKYYEWEVYQQFESTGLKEFFPQFYEIKIDYENSMVWIFMEHLNVLAESPAINTADLYKTTKRLAQLHSITFENQNLARLIRQTIPEFQEEKQEERLANLKSYLLEAKNEPALGEVIDQYCPEIYKLIKHPPCFRELFETGMCLTHGDLHFGNICYDDRVQKIKFIDLGVATYSSGWIDLVKLVETALDTYFEDEQDEIRNKCIQIYVEEMNQQGIHFTEETGRLYRLGYILRVFEKELRRNLRATLKGKRPFESEQILKKIRLFSKELHLI